MTARRFGASRLLMLLLALCAILPMVSCAGSGTRYFDIETVKTYRDIPGVDNGLVAAIEELKSSRDSFVFGAVLTTEAYILPSGELAGFGARLCELLTELFGIEFKLEFYEMDEQKRALDSFDIDFMGDYTPTAERMDAYFMTLPIAERSLRIFTHGDNPAIGTEADLNGLRIGFWSDSVTAASIRECYPALSFEAVSIGTAAEAAELLRTGEIDAYVCDGVADLAFERFRMVRSKEFFQLVYTPVSMTTANPELEPIIIAMNKYLTAGGIDKLFQIYWDSEHEYAKFKLNNSLTADEQAFLLRLEREGAKVEVALENDNYPVSFYNQEDGEFQGIAVDILREISSLTDIGFDPVMSTDATWSEIMDALEAGEASLVSQLLYTDKRRDRFLWTDVPYAASQYALLSRSDYPNIASSQIISATIGVVRRTANEELYRMWFPDNDNMVYYDSQDEALDALESGEIDLLMGSEYLLLAQTHYREKPGYKVNTLFSAPMESYFGFNTDETVLCSIINKAQPFIRSETIENDWTSRVFDYSRKYANERSLYLLFFVIILLIALVSSLFLYLKNQRIAHDYEMQAVKLSTIFSSIPDLLYSKDANLNYTSCNPSFEKLAGMSEAEVIGKNALEIFKAYPDMARGFAEVDERAVEECATQVVEDWYTFPDGSRRLFEAIKSPLIRNGTLVGVMGISRDITEHKKAEEDAYAASKAKSAFLAHMSHEIRTPMNAISGMTELIMREDMPPSIYEYVLDIKHASANMLSLVNDILDFSKIEAGGLEILPAEYSLRSLINDVLVIIRMKVSEKPAVFTANIDCNLPDRMIGDDTRLRQILLNVLGNAAKYTNEGYVSLTVTGDAPCDDTVMLMIEVSDSGIGIREEDMDKLFGDFVRFDGIVNRSTPGTGLGLAIVKSLCEAMDGSISVASEYGIGSTFSLTIPQKVCSFDERFARVDEPSKKRVLLFKKRSIYASSIVQSLENLDVECSLVTTIDSYREELASGRYAYVFTSCLLAEGALHDIEKLCPSAQLILLLDFGEVPAMRNVRTIIMPAHTGSIANILNDVEDNAFYSEISEVNMRFIAPTARALVVDDVQTNLKVTQGLLLPYQIQVDICSSGQEAVELAGKNRYDIIFMDHMMPEMDGIEATQAIRALPGADGYYKNVPIVALTANVVSGVSELLLKSGMDDFLTKPIDISKLGSILDKWIPGVKKEKYRKTKTQLPAEEMSAINIHIEGVDILAGLFTTGGSVDNYLKMLAVFHMDGIDKVQKLRGCLDRNDIKLYTIFVHALKSALMSIGALELSNFAKTLEMAGGRGDVGFVRENTDRFLTELNTLLDNIHAVVSKNRDKSAADFAPEYIKNMLTKLSYALSQKDAAEVDDIMSALEPIKWAQDAETAFAEISRNIYLFNYDGAEELVGKLLAII